MHLQILSDRRKKMSNSYIIELERLRVQLKDILRAKGKTVADDAPLNVLIPAVSSVLPIDALNDMYNGGTYDLIDTDGNITTMTGYTQRVRDVYLPEVISIGTAFGNNATVRDVRMPKLTNIPGGAFSGSTIRNFTGNSVNIGYTAFEGSRSLEHFTCNSVTGGGNYGFQNCVKLVTFETGSFTDVNMGAWFNNCSQLKIVDFGVIGTWSNGGFGNCPNVKAIVVRNTDAVKNITNQLATLVNQSADFKLYVPDTMVNSYKADSNYANYIGYIEPLSDYDRAAILNGASS